jgi:hypothetical protein
MRKMNKYNKSISWGYWITYIVEEDIEKPIYYIVIYLNLSFSSFILATPVDYFLGRVGQSLQ